MMQTVRESVMVGGRPLTLETGRLAKQAESAILVTYGDTQVLVPLCYQQPRAGVDFFPLTCDYVEKTYAAGKIPGGFFKREGRLRTPRCSPRASSIGRYARCSHPASRWTPS